MGYIRKEKMKTKKSKKVTLEDLTEAYYAYKNHLKREEEFHALRKMAEEYFNKLTLRASKEVLATFMREGNIL